MDEETTSDISTTDLETSSPEINETNEEINEAPEEMIEDIDYNKTVKMEKEDELKKLMKIDYDYPDTDDQDFQEKIYRKREFYYNKIPAREHIDTYDKIKDYRDKTCTTKVELLEQQSFLSNYINPDTPYRGVLVFWGTGVAPSRCSGAQGVAPVVKKLRQV